MQGVIELSSLHQPGVLSPYAQLRGAAEAFVTSLLWSPYCDYPTAEQLHIRAQRVTAGLELLTCVGCGQDEVVFRPLFETLKQRDEGEADVEGEKVLNAHSGLSHSRLEAIATAVSELCPINTALGSTLPEQGHVSAAIEALRSHLLMCIPMVPVRITRDGEMLSYEKWVPSEGSWPNRRIQKEDLISPEPFSPDIVTGKVGKHVGCNGCIHLRPTSDKHYNALCCECGLRVRIPSSIKTYQALMRMTF